MPVTRRTQATAARVMAWGMSPCASGERIDARARRGLRTIVLAFAAIAIPASAMAQAKGASGVRIVLEPDFLVSRDGGGAHVELDVSAHPRRPDVLVGGAITHGRPDGGPGTRVYATSDGGLSWTPATFPDQQRWGGGDPQVAFTPTGAALFATLLSRPDETGRTRAWLTVYRSEDGGATWSAPADLGGSYDHPMMVVDPTVGRYAGRVYISVLYGRDYTLGVFRSDDDGRTFVGPVPVAHGAGIGLNVTPMVVLSDGSLVMMWHDFPLDPAERSRPGPRTSTQWSAFSTDGGVTFEPARRVTDKVAPSYDSPDVRMFTDPAAAVDLSNRYRDRIYIVWTDFRNGAPRILLRSSPDRGVTWTEPRPVDPGAPAGTRQFQPVAAVNRDGVLGVAWYDTRGAGDETGFNEYFSASMDGGATFLPPVRVSSETSRPFDGGNLLYTPITFTTPGDSGAVRLVMLSAASRWGNGGDYLAMDADADGVFHPYWADARTGTYEVWTARIRVDSAATAPVNASPLEERDVTRWLEVVPDPSRVDAASKEVELRLRFRNTADRTIHGPLVLTIEKFGSGMGDDLREYSPQLLNATRGGSGEGAEFDLTAALGSSASLQPGATSGAVLLRLQMSDLLKVPDFHLRIRGRVEGR